MKNKKQSVNLDNMFKELNYKRKMEVIDKKLLYTGFINMYEDDSETKNIKHINIVDKQNGKNKNKFDEDNKFEKVFVYENNGVINNNEKENKSLTMKKMIDENKYYYINNNNNINKKIHKSKLFSKKVNK